jgi:hypothetical protein
VTEDAQPPPLVTGLWPVPGLSLESAGALLPFLKAGSAVLMRTVLLLGTKTLATSVAARSGCMVAEQAPNSAMPNKTNCILLGLPTKPGAPLPGCSVRLSVRPSVSPSVQSLVLSFVRGVANPRFVCPCRLGTIPVAAHQVLISIMLLSSMIIDSLAVAAQALVAIALGRGDVRQGRQVADRLLEVCLLLGPRVCLFADTSTLWDWAQGKSVCLPVCLPACLSWCRRCSGLQLLMVHASWRGRRASCNGVAPPVPGGEGGFGRRATCRRGRGRGNGGGLSAVERACPSLPHNARRA